MFGDQSKSGKTDLWKFLGYQQEAVYAANNVIPSVLQLVFPSTWLAKPLRLSSPVASH